MDLSRIHQLINAQIECCRQGLRRRRDLEISLSQRDGQALRLWSAGYQEDAARLRDLTRQLSGILQGLSLSQLADTLMEQERGALVDKSRELARASADWRLANARAFRFLRRTASASQSMLEQVYGLAGGYDSRGNMMNSYRSRYQDKS